MGIVTRGRAELAEKAVASALRQVPPPDLIWVIEDGLVGKPFAWQGSGPLRITRWNESRGYMAARQKMMMEAEADVYVSLDDDAWSLEPTAMVEAVRVMERDPKVAAVGFEILSPDCPQPSGKKGVEPAKMFIGCGHALRLKAVREVGGYEEMPGFYGGEEKDLCLRLMDMGWKVVKLVEIHVWHDLTPAQRNLDDQQASSVTNDLFLIWMRAPIFHLIPCFAGNFYNHLTFAIKNRYPLAPRIRGLIYFLRSWPNLFLKRKPVSNRVWKHRHRSAH